MMTCTFDSLIQADKKTLDRLMTESGAPTIDDVLGYEYRGYNLQPVTVLLGTRKFKKGFFGEPGQDYAWGYNVPVVQNGRCEPWVARPSDDDPKRHFFFKVFPGAMAERARYPNSLVVDYSKSGEYFVFNPIRYLVDYLVYPDPSNHDLILGSSCFEAGPVRFFMGHFILERHNKSSYGRTTHFLTAREMRTIEAFAEVFIEGSEEAISHHNVAWNIDRQLSRIESKRVCSLRLILFVIEYVLPLRHIRLAFSKMSPAGRKQFLETTLRAPHHRGLLRDLTKIKTLFTAGYYGDPRVYKSIDFLPVDRRPQYRKKIFSPHYTPRIRVRENHQTEIDCRVCVIGSGAAGAVVAYHAIQNGHGVVLLEQGPHVRTDDISHDEGAMIAKLYKEGGLQTTVDFDMTLLQGRCLGGSTVINNAICFRMNDSGLYQGVPDTLESWRALGAQIDEDGLQAAYERVESMLGVRSLPEVHDARVSPIEGGNGRVLLDGWRRLTERNAALSCYPSGLFRKNFHHCLGCGYCNFGCPYGRRLSTLETYIPQAINLGAQVITSCHAVGIDTHGGKALGVRCERRNGPPLYVRAEQVVISCGAIGSSVLLMKSGIRRNVGRRFSLNAGTPIFARFPNPIRGYDGDQLAAYIDAGDFLLESLFNPPLAFATTLPGWFGKHFDRMKAYDRLACAGVLVGTDHNAYVKRTRFWRDLFGPVAYKMTTADLDKMKRGIGLLARVFFEAGAEAVYPATFADVELHADDVRSHPEAITHLLDTWIHAPEDLTLSSSHPQGGNAMSDEPSIGVVDSSFRVHGYSNLYVCDASIFPTTIRVNPQLTIMAMADYFCHLGKL